MKKRTMPKWLQKIEKFVDRSMPAILILLTIVIILEFTEWGHHHEEWLLMADYFIISFFVVDLCFKWNHTRNVKKFVSLYWIDIIAVFPFYLVFRLWFVATELFTAGESAQKFLHEAVVIRETKLLEEAKAMRGTRFAGRLARQSRFIQTIARGLRLLRARWYVVWWHMHDHSRKLRS